MDLRQYGLAGLDSTGYIAITKLNNLKTGAVKLLRICLTGLHMKTFSLQRVFMTRSHFCFYFLLTARPGKNTPKF